MIMRRLELFSFIFVGITPCLSIKLDVFATRTIYKWPYESIVNTPVIGNSENFYTDGDKTCEAVHVYSVIRHGARHPSPSVVQNMPVLVDKLVQNKEPAKFKWLESWESRYPDDNLGNLVQEGIDEQIQLGKRFGLMFEKLFQTHGDKVKFVSSYQSRASNSSKYFHEGISTEVGTLPSYVNEINNKLTRFFDNCHNYVTQVENNASHLAEFDKYSETPEFQATTRAIEERLGLRVNLTASDVYLAYVMCSYELYIYGEDKWCDLLTDGDRIIVEYGKDIQKYYLKGNSHPIIAEMPCPLMKDILTTMDESKIEAGGAESISRYVSGKFVFGHESTNLALMSVLGLYKDEQRLQASNRAVMVDRQFRTSHTTPYTANIAFVVYACNDTANVNRRTYDVKLYVNERAVAIPACNKTVCGYEDFVRYYSPGVRGCDLAEICGTEESNSAIGMKVTLNLLPSLMISLLAVSNIS